VKTSRAALAAGLIAGLAAVPLTASAAGAVSPQGSATASALSVKVSLAPLKAAVDTLGATAGQAKLLNWQQVADALALLRGTLCPGSTDKATTCPLGVTLPADLPDSLTVNVAQAANTAVIDAAGTDVVSGTSTSTPVFTDWRVLNANIQVVQDQLTALVKGGTDALAAGGVNALTGFLTSSGPGQITATLPQLGTADFNLLGTVAASLNNTGKPDKLKDSASAVQVTLNGTNAGPLAGTMVTVDPFNAVAVNGANTSAYDLKAPEVSSANTAVGFKLPALTVNNANSAGLAALAAQLKSLIDALSKAIADPANAGNILSAAGSIPALQPLQGALNTIGGAITTATTAVAPVTNQNVVNLDALKAWDVKLSATLDGVNAVISALAGLNLPDVTNLLVSKDSLATTRTIPLAGGGVKSTATATLGSLSVLPIGDSLAGVLNPVISAAGAAITSTGVALDSVNAGTPLLKIEGVTSSAEAAVGPGTSAPVGSSGLQSVYVLGQKVDLDAITSKFNLGPGQDLTTQLRFPGLGANGGDGWLTLRISRGMPHVVANTDTYREINVAALAVTLSNGCGGPTCTDALGLPAAAKANTAAPRTATTSGNTGIAALGGDTDVVRLAVADTTASVSNVPSCNPGSSPTCPLPAPGCHPGTSPNCPLTADTAAITSLPKTGLFGGAALPAGLLLIAVAISLRLIPGLRTRLRGMR
jgi:hypothetical protein